MRGRGHPGGGGAGQGWVRPPSLSPWRTPRASLLLAGPLTVFPGSITVALAPPGAACGVAGHLCVK